MTHATTDASQPRRNIELKTVCRDLEAARRIVQTLRPRQSPRQVQTDTYFHAARGRLKLREILGNRAELIWYDRANVSDPRPSDYLLSPVPDVASMKALLTALHGVRGEVRKVRDIYLYHNVRIHLDRVESLGDFVEFEAVITGVGREADSLAVLERLRDALDLKAEDVVPQSYADLLGI
jgi:adenylate cyclase, class 2